MCFRRKEIKYMKFCPICGSFHTTNKYQSFKDVCHIYKQWQKNYHSTNHTEFEVGDMITPKNDKLTNYSTTFEGDILIICSINKTDNSIHARIVSTKQKEYGNIINNLTLDSLDPNDFELVSEELINSYYGGNNNG